MDYNKDQVISKSRKVILGWKSLFDSKSMPWRNQKGHMSWLPSEDTTAHNGVDKEAYQSPTRFADLCSLIKLESKENNVILWHYNYYLIFSSPVTVRKLNKASAFAINKNGECSPTVLLTATHKPGYKLFNRYGLFCKNPESSHGDKERLMTKYVRLISLMDVTEMQGTTPRVEKPWITHWLRTTSL